MLHIIIMLAAIFLGSTFFGNTQWFPYLAILICPIMMLFMMGGHNHSSEKKDNDHSSHISNHSGKLE